MNSTLHQLIEKRSDLAYSLKISCQCVIELVLQVSQPQINVWMSKFLLNHNENHDNVSTISEYLDGCIRLTFFFLVNSSVIFLAGDFVFSLSSAVVNYEIGISMGISLQDTCWYLRDCKQIEIFFVSCFFVWLSMQLNGKMGKNERWV